MLAVVFLDILPKSIETISAKSLFAYVLAGFLFFFVLTKILLLYHCHTGKCPIHRQQKRSGAKILFGDAVHNFIDGIIITVAFLADFNLGILTTIAVLIHEIPMEISDFFILLNAGYTRKKAIIYNFLIALTTPFGAVLTYFLAPNILNSFVGPALGIVAGNFLYIAAVDLIPELHDHKSIRATLSSILQFFLILLGIFIIYSLDAFFPG